MYVCGGGRGRRGRDRDRERNKYPVMEEMSDEGIPVLSSQMFAHKRKEKNRRALGEASDVHKTSILFSSNGGEGQYISASKNK